MNLTLLQLWHLADSALPIGSTSHSFGLETLVADGELTVETLPAFLECWLQETAALEAAACREAHGRPSPADWHGLNALLSRLRPARETRQASLALGRRFLRLVAELLPDDALRSAGDAHYCAAFGLAGGVLGADRIMTSMAYLQQAVGGLVSACQRLMPLGQTRAASLLWGLKPRLVEIAEQETSVSDCTGCMVHLEVASMRHPRLETRLFIS